MGRHKHIPTPDLIRELHYRNPNLQQTEIASLCGVSRQDVHAILNTYSRDDIKELENRIFALNWKIRSLAGRGPTDEWRRMMNQHAKLLAQYKKLGGTAFV